jgi:NAD(P)-dependent dehydrogenase (short-subunit alcohol dehydrogenase family)
MTDCLTCILRWTLKFEQIVTVHILVADDIISKSGNTNVVVRHLELSDFASVRKFAAQINAEEDALHILINNAGIVGTREKMHAVGGHELVLTTNHYGPFLLTHLLIGHEKFCYSDVLSY